MVITGGEGSDALVTEFSGIDVGGEEEMGTPAREVILTIVVIKNLDWFGFSISVEGKKSPTTLSSHSTL